MYNILTLDIYTFSSGTLTGREAMNDVHTQHYLYPCRKFHAIYIRKTDK